MLALAVFPPPAAHAQGEIALRWTACAPEGSLNFVQNCTSDMIERRIVFSFFPGVDATHVVGWSLVLDVASDATSLPAWWQVQPGGCRAGQLDAVLPGGLEGFCTDMWSAAGAGVVQSVIYPRNADPRQMRLILAVGVPAGAAFALTAGEPYLAGELALRFAGTTSGTCPGCDAGVCLVFNSAEIVRLPGAPGAGPTPFVTPSPLYGNQITSGGGTACALVPVVNRTWGHIKTLYR